MKLIDLLCSPAHTNTFQWEKQRPALQRFHWNEIWHKVSITWRLTKRCIICQAKIETKSVFQNDYCHSVQCSAHTSKLRIIASFEMYELAHNRRRATTNDPRTRFILISQRANGSMQTTFHSQIQTIATMVMVVVLLLPFTCFGFGWPYAECRSLAHANYAAVVWKWIRVKRLCYDLKFMWSV